MEIWKDIPNLKGYQVSNICRTGCMGCPYGSYKHDTEKELRLINDNQRKFVCQCFKESYKVLGVDKYVDLETGEMINRKGE